MIQQLIAQIKQKNTVSIFIALTFFFLCFTRLYQLADKPYHHDESLYAKYSYDYASQGHYRFDPVLHGPMLFTVQAALFKIFGDNDFTGRLGSALPGILLAYLYCYLLFLVYRRLEPLLALLVLFSLSPVLTYFSRFLGMDLLLSMLFAASLTSLHFFTQSKRFIHFLNTVLFLSLLACTKLNYLFYFFFIASFYITLYCFKRSYFIKINDSLKTSFLSKTYLKISLCIGLAVLTFSLLYSGFGQYWPGILDGLYRKMIPYWTHQNKIRRIRGPFDYYSLLLIQYEFSLILFMAYYFLRTVASSKYFIKATIVTLFLSLPLYFIIKTYWFSMFSSFFGTLHLDYPYHFLVLVFYIFAGACMTLHHLNKNQIFLAFCIFWFWVSLSLYGYAGEKAPWLLVHIVCPAFLYLAPRISEDLHTILNQNLKKRALGLILVILMSWQLLNVYRSSFTAAADPQNLLAQTHTSLETKTMAKKIVACKTQYPNLKFETLHTAKVFWPLAWYLRDYHGWFTVNQNPSEDSSIFIQDWYRTHSIYHPNLQQYTVYRHKLHESAVLHVSRSQLKYYLRYLLFWKGDAPNSSFDSAVFVHPRALDCWVNYE